MDDTGGGASSSSSSSSSARKSTPQPHLEAVLYTASASRRRVRTSVDTYALCAQLRGYGVDVDVRDVSKDHAFRYELKSLLAARGCPFSLPQLLLGGRLVGGADEVRQMHEAGELRHLLDGAPRQVPAYVCQEHVIVDLKPCWRCHQDRLKEEHNIILLDATKDVSVGGCAIEMEAPICVSLGAMRPLVKKLQRLLLSPQLGCKLPKVVKDRMHLLKDDLEEASACLEDLSELEDPPLAAKCWMNAARELSYDIADYIDSLVPLEVGSYRSVRKMSHVKIHKRLKWQKKILNTSVSRTIRVNVIHVPKRPTTWWQQIVERIAEFRVYVQEAIGRYERYQLHHRCSTTSAPKFAVPVGPMLPPPPGREKTNPGIVFDGRTSQFMDSLLNHGDQQLKVVSILGSGCLGKTTLAKALYNKAARQFHCRALIRVSKNPDINRLFHDMLSQIQKKQPVDDDYTQHHITDKIREHLLGKRYLIILDELWDTSTWDVISSVFPEGSQGSRIITTTQLEDVALACCCSDHVFEIRPPDDVVSRMLFFDRIFGSEGKCPEEFKQVASEIVEICGGLPLAISGIASMVANQPAISMDLFTHIRDSLCSDQPSESTSERTRQVLNLSYNNLPRYLKTCLLYLSMYPEGSIMFKCDLVKQWAAEGFVATTEGQDMEEIAGNYFDELVDRRFIQPIYESYNNEVVSCTVHDVVRDLIVQKSSQDNFIVVVDQNRKNMALSQNVHRLSLCFGDAKYAKTPASIRKSRVHSLGFFGSFECMPCIGEFKILRVLNLQQSVHHRGNKDPAALDLSGISDLLHLRYLKIACDGCLKLPNNMRALLCLETLDLKDTPSGTAVPWDIIYLPHLLHLSLPDNTYLLDWYVCPEIIGKFNNLQNLYVAIYSAPNPRDLDRRMRVMGSLVQAQLSLKTWILLSNGSSVKNCMVPTTRKVEYGLWKSIVLPPLLERFEVWRNGCCILTEIPRWIGKHGNLKVLKIAVRKLMRTSIGILGGLPALSALSLYVQTAPYEKIIFDKAAGFSVLKYLKLRFTSGIAWLKFESVPNLLKLKLVFSAIPRMDQKLYLFTNHPLVKQYQHGTAIISIDHMPGLREISAKFVGAAADLDYVSRIGVVSNHPSNPTIDVQFVDYGSYGNRSTTQQQQPDANLCEHDKTLEMSADKRISPRSPGPSSRQHVPEDAAQQQHVDWSNTIDRIGRDGFIDCLVRLSRSDYDSVASLNHDFYSLVRNGHIYRLRRKNGVAEHWVYLSSDGDHWVAYDPYRDRWIQVPTVPPFQMCSFQLLAIGTELLLLGEGIKMCKYSIQTNSWTWTDGMNTPRMYFASASDGQTAAYVAGGSTGFRQYLRSAEMYDSETHAWIPLPSMNKARSHCAGAFMDGKFYVIGGLGLTCGEEYDLKRRSWKVIDNMAQGITSAVQKPFVAVVNNELYAATRQSHRLKKYDKLDGTWITLGDLPEVSIDPYKDIRLIACGDRLVIGGYTAGMVELRSWIPADDQPLVWTLFARRRSTYGIMCASVMSC